MMPSRTNTTRGYRWPDVFTRPRRISFDSENKVYVEWERKARHIEHDGGFLEASLSDTGGSSISDGEWKNVPFLDGAKIKKIMDLEVGLDRSVGFDAYFLRHPKSFLRPVAGLEQKRLYLDDSGVIIGYCEQEASRSIDGSDEGQPLIAILDTRENFVDPERRGDGPCQSPGGGLTARKLYDELSKLRFYRE
ncbi:hypothetical protein OQA88_3280 [Cercophora sp. LCS_1]